MKLKDCTYGKLVTVDGDGFREDRVGMIVGITSCCPLEHATTRCLIGNAIPLVRWSCGAEHGINASHLMELK